MESHDTKGNSQDNEHSLKEAKLLEEIRGLKQQRLIAILSAIGAVLVFLVTNYTKITDIFYPSPKFRLAVEDTYLQQVGGLLVYKSQDSSSPVLKTSIAEALDWLPMQEGAFRLELTVEDETFFKKELFLAAGDRETLIIPPQKQTQTIEVSVFNDTPRPPPGSPLHLRVISSGNGFLWVYDLPEVGKPALVYPPLSGLGSKLHAIAAGESFSIPDPDKNVIFTASEPGEENLLVVVTSSKQRTTADKIADKMASTTISKASAGRIEENWGLKQLHYKVGF